MSIGKDFLIYFYYINLLNKIYIWHSKKVWVFAET